jgi:lipase
MSRVAWESVVSVNGVDLAVYDRPGEEPAILFCHATGFHAHIWNRIVEHFPRNRLIAFDARGHGRSSKPAPPYSYPWRDFAYDIAALADALNLAGAIGVGHSLGGYAVALAAALRPESFATLALFDAVVHSRDRYTGPWEKNTYVGKRRNDWSSPEEMFERFENRPPFDSWDRQTLRDYCNYALIPSANGFALACSSTIEASIYRGSTSLESDIYHELATIQIPVHVVRAGRYPPGTDSMRPSLTTPDLAAIFRQGRDTLLTDYSHFIPQEAPDLSAKLITDTIALL